MIAPPGSPASEAPGLLADRGPAYAPLVRSRDW
jgi:hypothetical protein